MINLFDVIYTFRCINFYQRGKFAPALRVHSLHLSKSLKGYDPHKLTLHEYIGENMQAGFSNMEDIHELIL